ncbi:MAG: NusG domain II-containing protein [Chitinispirillaceae bacterium]|nr:NusG domain II-containing protein [Chitinispirillaceae bacterium]
MPKNQAGRQRPRSLAPLDAVVMALLLCAGIAFIPITASHAPATATVYRDNTVVAHYPLSASAEFFIQGANGRMKARIEHGALRIDSSNCPRQICRHSAPISRPFEQIVCVPNHILIEISAGGREEIDAIAR